MIYLVLNIALFLIVAAGIGFGVGWVLRQQTGASRESELHRGTMEVKSRIPQLETTIRHRDREVTRLSLELQDSQARIPELEETIRDSEAAVLEGERNLRQLTNEITSLRGSAVANGSAGGENFAVLEDADLEGFDDPQRGTVDESALQRQIEELLGRIAEREQRIALLEAKGTQDTDTTIGATAELELRIEALQTENAELVGRLPEAGMVDDRQRTIDELQQQLDQTGARLAERDSEVDALTARVDTLTRASADAANEQGLAQVVERDLQIATLSARVSDMDAEAEERLREFARLEREHRSAAEQIPKLEDACREHDEARKTLQRQLDERREDMGAQQAQLGIRTADNERLQRELAVLQDQLDALHGEVRGGEQRIEALAEDAVERDELTGKVNDLEQKLIAQASHYRGQAEGMEAGQDELDATRERLTELEDQLGERDSAVAELNSTAVDHEELLRQLAEQSSEVESLASQLHEASSHARASETGLEQRVTELTDVRVALESVEGRLPELERTLESIAEERDQLTEQVHDLETGAHATADATSKIGTELAELQQLAGERAAQIDVLQTEATNQNKRLEEMTGELAARNELVADLQRQREPASLDDGRHASSDDGPSPEGDPQDDAPGHRGGTPDPQAVLRELDQRKRQITRLEREQGLQQQTMQVLSQQLEDARQTHTRLSETISDRDTRISELESDSGAKGAADAAPPSLLLGCRPDDCDNLQRIRGIGAALEKALNELGIYRLRQIAALNDADIKWVDHNLRGFKGRIVRDAWVRQADELSFGG